VFYLLAFLSLSVLILISFSPVVTSSTRCVDKQASYFLSFSMIVPFQ
jgi:hypothetical protein